MTDLKVAAVTTTRTAAGLVPGDRIAGDFLPAVPEGADVEFVGGYQLLDERWVMVVFRLDDGLLYSDSFLADAKIPLERTAADLGHGFSREADDPTPVSPARVPLHTGSVVEGDELIVDGQS